MTRPPKVQDGKDIKFRVSDADLATLELAAEIEDCHLHDLLRQAIGVAAGKVRADKFFAEKVLNARRIRDVKGGLPAFIPDYPRATEHVWGTDGAPKDLASSEEWRDGEPGGFRTWLEIVEEEMDLAKGEVEASQKAIEDLKDPS